MKKRGYRGAVKKMVLLMTLAGLVCGGKGAGVFAAESVAEDSYAMTAESAAEEYYAAVPVVRSTDTLKLLDKDGVVAGSVDRETIFRQIQLRPRE